MIQKDNKIIDYHCHILPSFDDGANTIDVSLQMLNLMSQQGVKTIVATPHYYAHKGESVEEYLQRRSVAYKSLINNIDDYNIILGSEVAIEQNISSLENIEKLVMGSTNYILLEMPYITYEPWIEEEIYNISCMGLVPIIAHVERYETMYPHNYLTRILNISNGLAQFNNESLKKRHIRNMIMRISEQGYEYILGSDSHNIKDRKPDWNIYRKLKYKKILQNSVQIL